MAVSSADLKREIRIAAEKEEQENYGRRMSPEWLRALESLGTDANKPFLETAPWLVVLLQAGLRDRCQRRANSSLLCGRVGRDRGRDVSRRRPPGRTWVALTHTPSPMGFLKRILNRPANETATLLMPVGYPSPDATVPDLQRKSPRRGPAGDVTRLSRRGQRWSRGPAPGRMRQVLPVQAGEEL